MSDQKHIAFHVISPGEPAAGLPGFTEDITIAVQSGDLADREKEFTEHMRKALADWYDGARVLSANPYPRRRSQAEVEALKASWLSDPCWDIESTEGFEAHRDELLTFHYEQKIQWRRDDEERATRWGMTHLGASIVAGLRSQVEKLEERIEEVANGKA